MKLSTIVFSYLYKCIYYFSEPTLRIPWVEGGRIAHPVHEVTIAGHLRDMFKGIVAVGADAYASGAKTTGSILVERMKLAGS